MWDQIRRILHSQLSVKYMLPAPTPEIGWIKFPGSLVIRRGRMSLPKFQNILILPKGILAKSHSENIQDLAVTRAQFIFIILRLETIHNSCNLFIVSLAPILPNDGLRLPDPQAGLCQGLALLGGALQIGLRSQP